MKTTFLMLAAGAALFATSALAEPYVDYTPLKGVWHVTRVKVEPNRVDDYVTGLKKLWAPGEEVAKKHGLIDSYAIRIKINPADGQANVLLIEHIPNMAMMEVDQARDQAIQKEVLALTPKTQADAKVKEFDGYRTFVGDDYWTDIEFTK